MSYRPDVHVPHGSSEGTIQDDKVLKRHVGEQLVQQALISGGAAGDHTVTGITTDDTLVSVIHNTAGTLADLTDEFSITGDDTINNAGGTDTSSDQLLVTYQDNS